MEAGRPHGIVPAAPNTIRSIEGALLSYVSDIRRQDNPYTLGLERLVQLDKPAEFIGREALRRIRDRGNHRRLVGIEIEGEAIPGNPSFWPVHAAEGRIGHVSRCVWSPRLERNIGFANVPANHTDCGTALTVETSGGPRPATVVQTPWFPAIKDIPAGIRDETARP
jgi:aminomethyltransferase